MLVIWTLADGKKTYLPRLGAPLTKIVARRDDPSRLALFGADNAIRLVNVASLTVEGTIQGVRPPVLDASVAPGAYASVVAYDPRADVAVFLPPARRCNFSITRATTTSPISPWRR